MTKTLTKFAIGLFFLLAVAFFIKSYFIKDPVKDTTSEIQENTDIVTDQKNITSIQTKNCVPQSERSWAYQVSAMVSTTAQASNINQQTNKNIVQNQKQTLYQSTLNFTLELAEQSKQVKGLANHINIKENGQPDKNLPDVAFLAFNQSNQFAEFGFFDDLGLTANHPMKLLNPFIKHLSVADAGKQVVYAYDPLAVNYTYQHQFPTVTRTKLNKNAMQQAHDWQVTLAQDCLVEQMQAKEQIPFKLGTTDAVMTYEFMAKRVPSSRSLAGINFSTSVNANQQWHNASIDADKTHGNQNQQDIKNNTQMLQAFANFANNKNTGQLKKAADYLIKNNTPEQVASMLMDAQINEGTKRDLAFALSLAEGEQVQGYILDTLTQLPTQTDAQGDVQKVRLMVALSGRGDVTTNSFNRLLNLRKNTDTSDNVKNNVLISSAKVAQDLAKKGQTQPLSVFKSEVDSQLQTYDDNASSAILAAGNAKIDTQLTNQLISQLNKGTEKSRYAAASVLARNDANYDVLINHLNQEPSLIVFQSAVSAMDKAKLNSNQTAQLQNLKAQLQQQPQNQLNQQKIGLLDGLAP